MREDIARQYTRRANSIALPDLNHEDTENAKSSLAGYIPLRALHIFVVNRAREALEEA